MNERIKITKQPKLKNPVLIVSWPGMGEVAYKSASYLISALKAKEFAKLSPEDFFYPVSSSIKDGVLDIPQLPWNKFYYWQNPANKVKPSSANDLIIFLSNAQPDLAHAKSYSEEVFFLAKKFKVKQVIGLAAMPVPIDHTQTPQVWFTATDKELVNETKQYGLKIMETGQISGMNGLFLGLAKSQGFKGVCLLGEIPLYTIQIENPKAAIAVLEKLGKILSIPIDVSGLTKEAGVVDAEINKLLTYFKLGGEGPTPIGEEDIEKFKKSLSQYTKLPVSVKEKIDKLFEEAKKDISKASELKKELDQWSVYKDYEDKFLDLFKKQKHDDNRH